MEPAGSADPLVAALRGRLGELGLPSGSSWSVESGYHNVRATDSASVFCKIMGEGSKTSRLGRELRFASSFAGAAFTPLVPGLVEFELNGELRFASVWEFLPGVQPLGVEGLTLGNCGEVASRLAGLHGMPLAGLDSVFTLVELREIVERRLAGFRGLVDERSLRVFSLLADEFLYSDFAFDVSHVIHGDAHLSNVVESAVGVRWSDFEGVCLGPREWDVATLSLFAGRLGGRQSELEVMLQVFEAEEPLDAGLLNRFEVVKALTFVSAVAQDPRNVPTFVSWMGQLALLLDGAAFPHSLEKIVY